MKNHDLKQISKTLQKVFSEPGDVDQKLDIKLLDRAIQYQRNLILQQIADELKRLNY